MTVNSGVFVIHEDQRLVAMQQTQFAAEVDFQSLLTKFPALLVGDQINPENPRRFLLVKQEQAIGHDGGMARWSIDHLFLDQDGVPTLVEVKRQSDTRLRREVVGQMLDYAANCQSYWSAESIRSTFEATCLADTLDSEAVLRAILDAEVQPDKFWNEVKLNLQAGKIRMLFVADEIPSELRRIVEFLNKQMDPAEILAIELRHFTGQGLRTLVPVVFGQTQEATKKKSLPNGIKWTQERIFDLIELKFGQSELDVARDIVAWMNTCGFPLGYGTGRDNGSIYPIFKPQGVQINPAYLSTEGKIWLQCKSLIGKPVFGERARRLELLRRFGEVADSDLGNADPDGWPSLSLAKIAADPDGRRKLVSAFAWIADQVRSSIRTD